MGRNVLVACVILAFCAVIAGGSYYLAGKRAVGNMLVNLGQQIGGAGSQSNGTVATPPGPNTATPGAPGGLVADAPRSAAPSQDAPVPNPTPSAAPPAAPNTTQPPTESALPQSPADSNGEDSASQAAQRLNANVAIPNAKADGSTSGQTAAQPEGASAALSAKVPEVGTPKRPANSPAIGQAAALDHGQADLDRALQYLRGPNRQDSAVAEELLWSAIGKGDTQAEFVLGGLYLRGQGAVHKNCRQAEVLLHAALVADVPGAEEKIGELQTYGCH